MNKLSTLQNCILLGVAFYVLRFVAGGFSAPMQSNFTSNTANKGVFSSGKVLRNNGSTSAVRVTDRYGKTSIIHVTGDLVEGSTFIGGRSENGRFYAK